MSNLLSDDGLVHKYFGGTSPRHYTAGDRFGHNTYAVCERDAMEGNVRYTYLTFYVVEDPVSCLRCLAGMT